MSYMDDFRHLEIQLEDVKAATNSFMDKPIGAGGFGAVYKGELLLPNGRKMAAFKRLDRKQGQGDVEFWKEITMLCELKHTNLATLLHFCREGDERILVYEYASRRSLDGYLDKASLTWTQRLNICLGAATAIAYLHDPKKTQQRIVHRDIKSSNILLDNEWTAKVSDFGLSKITPANQPRTYVVSNTVGTPGYYAPEYHESGILSKECDVYSFGVVLFEVMCGRLCYEFDNDKLVCILVHTWKNRYDEDRLDDIIFPDLKKQINQESLLTFAAIARQCLDRDHKLRPNMAEVVKQLEVALHHQQNSKQHKADIVAEIPTFMEEFIFLSIPLSVIRKATVNFSADYMIGRGEFGHVYKGILYQQGEPITVLIKRLDRRLGQGDAEFWKEILFLSEFKHQNVVSLLNFCYEDGELILVHNNASHGSLDSYLGDPSLSWTQRLIISIGVANAMKYLHNHRYLHDPQDPIQSVLHRDIKGSDILLGRDSTPIVSSSFGQSKFDPANKSQRDGSFDVVGRTGYDDLSWTQRLNISYGLANVMAYLSNSLHLLDPRRPKLSVLHGGLQSSNILLDRDWTPRVSDFGQSKFDQTDSSSFDVVGDVLSMETDILTKQSDVYSLGVVLFELMCGTSCTKYHNGELTLFVPKWIICYEEKRLDQIIFSDLEEQVDSCSLNTFSSIAYRCLKSTQEGPTMGEVMKELEMALEQQEDFQETMRIQRLAISPIANTSENQKNLRFPNGVLVGDGNTWLSALVNWKVCEVISAAKCIFGDSFVHDDALKSRFSNVIKGRMHNGFSVKVSTQFLSPNVKYTVSLVFKHNSASHGTHIPFKFKLDEDRYYSDSCLTRVRDDGWLMIEVHQFTSYKRDHDLDMQFLPLFNISSSSIEYFLEGIEFRPVMYVS